jgi:UDP-glucose 4-epimerase
MGWYISWSVWAKGQLCLIVGDEGQIMDFVLVEGVARANLIAAKSAETDDVLNIASGPRPSRGNWP